MTRSPSMSTPGTDRSPDECGAPDSSYSAPGTVEHLRDLEPEVVATVRRWLSASAQQRPDRAATRLADMLSDDAGLAFTVAFVDRVVRPEDVDVAAAELRELARHAPAFLPAHLRVALRLGGVAASLFPRLVIPVTRRLLRRMVAHLVLDARSAPLGRALRRIRSDKGVRVNINLLGEMVMGADEAGRRLAETRRLLGRPDVDYVSIKVSSTVAPHNPWAFDEAVEHICEALAPLYRDAATTSVPKFVNLDMEEYHDLRLTVAVFRRLLGRDEFHQLRAGIALQAYLPDSLAAMIELQKWAAARVAAGGAPIKVRIVKGANLPMERVDAAVHGWPLATWHSKQDSDTHYKRMLDYALTPERAANVAIGVAGHNLFDVAFAWHLAQQRDVTQHVEFEMLLGMAPGQAAAVRAEVGSLLLYTPVVHPKQFDVAIAYLIRRLEEGASSDNFMSAVFAVHDDPVLFDRERSRHAASLDALDRRVPAPHRVHAHVVPQHSGFANAADTDPSVAANLDWGREILARVERSTLGEAEIADAAVTTAEDLERCLTRATATDWTRRPAAERATVLRGAAVELGQRRAELIEVMAAECGKTIDQSDPEISEAIDFANFYADCATGLDTVDGARHRAVGLTVVTPPWNFPVAIPAGSVLAALAAGSSVIIKPAPQARRCGAVMVAALHAAGVPRDALQLLDVEEGPLGQALVSDPRVGRVILTGGYATAELFRSWRHDLPLLAETSGKNAIIVTPSADLDLAVKDLVQSAFGHAGQKCSAASLAILVGSVADSERFRTQLIDAIDSLRVGPPSDPTSQVGPLVEPAAGKLLAALTTLDPGERWLVEPRRLDTVGKLWRPGVKTGVRRGSAFHLTEYFGPVLGIMRAATLEEAIELQNAVDYGLTAGLFSLDPAEQTFWLERVQAGNLYLNRGITGAIVRRQPFGGWKRSAVGAGTKAGGPNYLIGLSDWTTAPALDGQQPSSTVLAVLDAAPGLDGGARSMLRRAARSDAAAWTTQFGVARDVSALEVERNVLRYRPADVTVRWSSGPLEALVRVIAAGVAAQAGVTVSVPEPLPESLTSALEAGGLRVRVEDEPAWRSHTANLRDARVRVVGDADSTHLAVAGRADIAIYDQPVTEAGRIELLPFVREQAVSITAHRFGSPDPSARKVQV